MGCDTRIQLCGRLIVELDGRHVQEEFPGRQGRILFGYLAAHRERAHTRDALIEALWPEGPPGRADSGLSALLSGLRRALGRDALEGRSEIRLVLPPGTWIDAEAAEDAVHRAESASARCDWARTWGPALAAYFISRRGFLPEVDAPWADERRWRLEEIRLSSLECYIRCGLGLGGGELPVAERAARELAASAPFRESATLLLMKVLCARGNAAEAIRAYEDLRARLRDELGISPSPALRDLETAILRTGAAAGQQ